MRRRQNRSAERSSFFEKLLLSVMGPAEIGEDKPPEGFVPNEAANFCHRCDQLWTAHERVHTGRVTLRVCPEPHTGLASDDLAVREADPT